MKGWRPGLFGRARDDIRARELRKITEELAKLRARRRAGKASPTDGQRMDDLFTRRAELRREKAEG